MPSLSLRAFLLLVILCCAHAVPGRAQDKAEVALRSGNHPGFGRVVYEFAGNFDFRVVREGDQLRISFPGRETVPGGGSLPRNVSALRGGTGEATITVVPDAQVRTTRLGNRLVIDVLDPERGTTPPVVAAKPVQSQTAVAKMVPAKPAPAPAPAPARVQQPERSPARAKSQEPPAGALAEAQAPARAGVSTISFQRVEDLLTPSADQAAAVVPAPRAIQRDVVREEVAPPAAPSAPLAQAARPAAAPASFALRAQVRTTADGEELRLPFSVTSGLAALRRPGVVLLVIDERRPIDVASIASNSAFAGASVRLLPSATVIRLPARPGQEPRFGHGEAGWSVRWESRPTNLAPISPAIQDKALRLDAAQPGTVVTVDDPETGANTLVGTQRQPGQFLAVARQAPEYGLAPTWQGVEVQPVSDRISLRAAADGFIIAAQGQELVLGFSRADAEAQARARNLTRRFDFPQQSVPELSRRMQQLVAATGAAPAMERFAPRMQAAQAMIALGFATEAQTVLSLAVSDEPRRADDPELIGLTSIAALLAGRDAEAGGLDDPRLNGTDEMALWRAVKRARAQEGAADAAANFAATLPLLLSYPQPLRDRLLPIAAETMAQGGELATAQALLDARPDDPLLVFARGMVLERHGKIDDALTVFESLAGSRDRLLYARAGERAAEARLAGGKATHAETADRLEKQFLSWRGDGRELRLRQRASDLRADAGQWRPALLTLREAADGFPDQAPQLRGRMEAVFMRMLEAADQADSIDFVAGLVEFGDLLKDGPETGRLATMLADRLARLELPARAAPLLETLMKAAHAGPVQAGYGVRLAEMRLAEMRLDSGDAEGALAALAASGAEDLPAELEEKRALLSARAWSGRGDGRRAVEILAGLHTDAAMSLKAAMLEAEKNWPGARDALSELVGIRVPESGPLDDTQQSLVLRLASAASLAGDAGRLADLARRDGGRMQGKFGDTFRLLTGPAVRGMRDLPAVSRDVAALKSLASGLGALSVR